MHANNLKSISSMVMQHKLSGISTHKIPCNHLM